MTRGPLLTGLSPNLISFASATRRAAVGIRDERGGEREQSNREHDERAVHMGDLAHRSLLSGFVCAPITLDPTPNRPATSG